MDRKMMETIRQRSEDLRDELKELEQWNEKALQRQAAAEARNKKSVARSFPDATELPIRGTVPSIKEAIQTRLRSQAGTADAKSGSTNSTHSSTTTNNMPTAEQTAAQQAKDCGNEYFRANKLDDAIHAYTRGIEADAYGPTAAVLYNNRAMCHLKLQHWADAEADATACLQLDRSLIKAYYRRAMARKYLNKLKDARLDLESVLALSPSDDAALAEMQELTSRMQAMRVGNSDRTQIKHKVVIEEVDDDDDEQREENEDAAENAKSATANVRNSETNVSLDNNETNNNVMPDSPDSAQRERRIRDELQELARVRKEAEASQKRAATTQEEAMKVRLRQNSRVTIVEDDEDAENTRDTSDNTIRNKSENSSALCADANHPAASTESSRESHIDSHTLPSTSTNGHGRARNGHSEVHVCPDVNASAHVKSATTTTARTIQPAQHAATSVCGTRVRSKPTKESLVAPRSFTDLERQLGALDKYPDLQQHYVSLLDPAKMRTLMGSNLTPEVLVAILSAIKHFAGPEALMFVKGLCTVHRIEDIAMFFSPQERRLAQEVLSMVQASGASAVDMTQFQRKLGAL